MLFKNSLFSLLNNKKSKKKLIIKYIFFVIKNKK